ncbi:MAG: hypothetical protein AAGK02_00320 [Pseudomonadota bacterium]
MRLLAHIGLALTLLFGNQAKAEGTLWVLSPDRRSIVLEAPLPISAELRLAGAAEGTELEVGESTNGLTELTSKWPLMLGTAYEVRLQRSDAEQIIAIDAPLAADTPMPGVAGLSHQNSVVPANALRLYLDFATPMARGQAAEFVQLVDQDGQEVVNAFLNLGVELWSDDQRRLTILFDPGRLKHGVGPNVTLGAPLTPGGRYGIRVKRGIRDAMGRALSGDDVKWFDVGEAVRKAIEPEAWSVAVKGGALRVSFDRAMDAQAALRSVYLRLSDGRRLPAGKLQSDGSLTWSIEGVDVEEMLAIVVNPDLEDTAGNTICAPFDAQVGQGKICTESVALPLN